MFFHGINFTYLKKQFPFLYPDANVTTKKPEQLKDREHLIQQFGLEPVHLLEASIHYPVHKCIRECQTFGEIVLAFKKLPDPFFQISCHEIGVPFLDIRDCSFVFLSSHRLKDKIHSLGLKAPIITVK